MQDSNTYHESRYDGGSEPIREPVPFEEWVDRSSDLIVEAAQELMSDDDFRASLREIVTDALIEQHNWPLGGRHKHREILDATMRGLWNRAATTVRDTQNVRFDD